MFFLPEISYPTEYNTKGSDGSSPVYIQKVIKYLSHALTYAADATFSALFRMHGKSSRVMKEVSNPIYQPPLSTKPCHSSQTPVTSEAP